MKYMNCQEGLLKKLFFGPLTEALDVGAVGKEDEYGQDQADRQKEFKLRGPGVAPGDHHGKN